MSHQLIAYLTFFVVLLAALLFDLGLLSKRNKVVSIKAAAWQTVFWVTLAMAFFIFLFIDEGQKTALEYLSAYLMEWSLSIDNIFVFL
jgi:tellurite resistance protein TerC